MFQAKEGCSPADGLYERPRPQSTDLLGKSKAYDSRAVPVQRLAEWSDGEKVNGIAGGVERVVNLQTVSRTVTRLGFGAPLESERDEKNLQKSLQ
jgi:hypothetical protein